MHATFPTFFDLYNAFADACDIPKGSLIDPPNRKAVNLAWALIEEEFQEELVPHMETYAKQPTLENLTAVADDIADTIYVLCQLARTLGIPLNKVYNEVHLNNMTKVGSDGKVKRREDGKILKPEGFQPVDIFSVLLVASNREAIKRRKMGAENWPKVTE